MQRLVYQALLAVCLAFAFSGFTADTPETTPASGQTNNAAADSLQALRAYLQLQEQLHSTTTLIEQARKENEAAARRHGEAIEQAREESEAAAKRNAETIAARLKLIEETLTMQREREIEVIQKSNRMLITIVAVVGGLGLLAVVFTAFFLWRALNRVAHISTALQPLYTMNARQAALHPADAPIVTLNGPEASNSRLLGALEKLEKRIHELENTAARQHLRSSDSSEDRQTTSTSSADEVTALIAKGQKFLDSKEPQKALECFDAALELEAHNAEALVKKGTALEQTKRLEEAIECYDKAIAVNQGLTVAYLHKGAVYNQLERFSEALECYEQALRTQHKPVNS